MLREYKKEINDMKIRLSDVLKESNSFKIQRVKLYFDLLLVK